MGKKRTKALNENNRHNALKQKKEYLLWSFSFLPDLHFVQTCVQYATPPPRENNALVRNFWSHGSWR